MKNRDKSSRIWIDNKSAVPKYLQLADHIISQVRSGALAKGMLMPSINELSNEAEVSRPTAQKAYKHLQRIKVLDSVPGKCYYITGSSGGSPLRIALFFNKLSAHKKIIYDAFINELPLDVSTDLFVYNNDYALFKSLLEQKSGDYTHYVIIPHFLSNSGEATRLINKIPKHKLILLDKKLHGVTGQYGVVYEDFQEDIFTALQNAQPLLQKYNTIKIVFPASSYFPQEILIGFESFCKRYGYGSKVITDLAADITVAGDAYVTLIETDLVTLVERVTQERIQLGRNVGIISYNETPIKKIIRDGITTISTDFHLMGQEAARLIMHNSRAQIQIPFSMIRRPSL